jgi:acetyl-CoA synthetase
MAEQLDWYKKWDKVRKVDFKEAKHEWFIGGKLNVSQNCLDRHLKSWRKNKAALIWEGDIGDTKTLTYQELYHEVCKFANVLKKFGVKKGDRVSIYLPMIVELPIAMLACARIGAIHSVVFGGFSADALRDRILDCGSTFLICCDGYYRSGKVIRSKDNADTALKSCPDVKNVIVVNRVNMKDCLVEGRDHWWDKEMAAADIKPVCEPEKMDSEDPLFILYTSGSTGKPRAFSTHRPATSSFAINLKWIFDVKEEDTYWCTAIWLGNGHSYIVYGSSFLRRNQPYVRGVPT